MEYTFYDLEPYNEHVQRAYDTGTRPTEKFYQMRAFSVPVVVGQYTYLTLLREVADTSKFTLFMGNKDVREVLIGDIRSLQEYALEKGLYANDPILQKRFVRLTLEHFSIE